jgi:hypothetical protein
VRLDGRFLGVATKGHLHVDAWVFTAIANPFTETQYASLLDPESGNRNSRTHSRVLASTSLARTSPRA